jgi:hypothetical protein
LSFRSLCLALRIRFKKSAVRLRLGGQGKGAKTAEAIMAVTVDATGGDGTSRIRRDAVQL